MGLVKSVIKNVGNNESGTIGKACHALFYTCDTPHVCF